MSKYTFSFLLFSFLVLPVLVFAETGVLEKTREKLKEQNISERVQKIETRTTEAAQKAEERIKERQEKITERTQKIEERKEAAQKNFCSHIAESLSERQADFTERQAEFLAKKSERTTKRTEKREVIDAEVEEKRKALEERRAKMYQNLLNNATTDEQKAAVATFQVAVEKAVDEREKALDIARTAFRTGIESARNSRNTDGSEALAAFNATMKTALAKVSSECESDAVDQNSIRSEYMSTLESARKTLNESRQDNGIGETVAKLAETRITAVRITLTTYRTAVEEASQALKTAFDEKVTTEETLVTEPVE